MALRAIRNHKHQEHLAVAGILLGLSNRSCGKQPQMPAYQFRGPQYETLLHIPYMI